MKNLIRPITETEANSILKLRVDSENLDIAYEKYSNAILDVFDHQLSLEDANKLLGSFMEHNIKFEHRYIQFIEDVYKLNNHMPVIVEVYLNEIESINILRILQFLDFKDKLLFIDLIRNNENRSHLFLIEDKEILSLFLKLSTRELLFSIFHFTNIPMTMVGNFELSFPVFFSNENDLKEYLNIARNNNLFFRNVHIKF